MRKEFFQTFFGRAGADNGYLAVTKKRLVEYRLNNFFYFVYVHCTPVITTLKQPKNSFYRPSWGTH